MNNPIAAHIITYPEHCSLLFIKNGETVVSLNEHYKRPLASVFKLVVLLTYLEQCKTGNIHPEDPVHFRELKRYWIHWIDPAFMKWYQKVKTEDKIKMDCIALHEVVIGMLEYSCNTNTDYLLAILGIDAVNGQLVKYRISDHDAVVPISTSVLISLRDVGIAHTPASLAKVANTSFECLIQGKAIEGLDLNLLNDFDYKRQCDWSDILPHATADGYVNLLQKLQRLHRDNVALQDLMKWFTRLKSYKRFPIGGMKLGYTPKVFNTVLYVADHIGNEYQLVYFINELDTDQREMMELASNDFNLKMLKDRNFVNTLKNEINHVLVH